MTQTIRTLLKQKDLTGGKIAKQLKCNRSSVYQSLKGEGSREIRVYIAKQLDQPPSQLWTDNDKRKTIVDDYEYMNCDQL